ncbi:hypothetical protein [Jeotgalibacillus terrae]|uniref:Uncharacterized protein n=1 Tax=Jeotgalibacillus terrae TaxID=587735 RepID=A0ABW5ZNC1_9BACL|nr:hypothetical protein [Jeotgalibacillus terrae]MBM7581080.1 hypothetical protein [Jeotgalibacillus terrae]
MDEEVFTELVLRLAQEHKLIPYLERVTKIQSIKALLDSCAGPGEIEAKTQEIILIAYNRLQLKAVK